MLGRRLRAVVLSAVVAVGAGLAVPTTLSGSADAASQDFSVSNWTDPNGQLHRIRWDPCTTITYAVNVRRSGSSPAARSSALHDVREAMRRASSRSGLTFHFVGRTREIPKDAAQSWSDRQQAAEIVIAWVDQRRAATSSDLLIKSGNGYVSGTGGWVWKAWTEGSDWELAIGRGFVVVNAADNHLYSPGFGSGTTRGALLMHEIGHALGLGHVGSTSELMYPQMLSRPSTRYEPGDRMGLDKVGAGLGCVPGTAKAWTQI